ncbi:MAG TPA: energy-coupling factor transporter transmembrane component T [Bacillota bacterium]|nr:energy-coupling factor transporter transmembrane component T [Bacillota bacterium]
MNKGLNSLHPFTSFFYFIGFMILTMTLLHPIYLITGLIIMIGLNYCIDRGTQLRSYLPFYLFMGITIALVNPLFSHRGRMILFYFMDQPITGEAVVYGLTMMLSLLCVLVSFVAYNQVMTSGKFLFLFSKAFQKMGLLVMMAVRFVPLVKRRMNQIMVVQKTRGVNPFVGPLRKRLKDAVLILQIVVTWSLEEALQTSDSMKARGYGILEKRSSYHSYRFRKMDGVVLFLLIITGSICMTGSFLGYGVLAIYPKLKWDGFHGLQWLFYFSFILFTMVPILIEGRESMKWRS